jgi:hypothetical protein
MDMPSDGILGILHQSAMTLAAGPDDHGIVLHFLADTSGKLARLRSLGGAGTVITDEFSIWLTFARDPPCAGRFAPY